MLKNSTYKEKFAMLKLWMPTIINDIKKELKNEHLKNDWIFTKKYLAGKNINKVTSDELAEAYTRAVAEEETAEEMGEFLTNRWLLKHGDIYHFFEEKLTAIDPNFGELETLDSQKSQEIVESATAQFGAPNTYLFSVLNSVVFPQEVYDQLSAKAKKTADQQVIENQEKLENASAEMMQRNYDQQIARLTDKYEKKLLGMQKKYFQDVDTLKKQVSTLTRKLNG